MPSQVIILGMHRSGTSLAGQVLEALGFYFAPKEKAAAPKKDNPLGYWERTDINRLSDQAFATQGVTWEKIDAWTPESLSAAYLDQFNAAARAILAGYPEDQPCFIKDPRMCITLPLWEKHFSDPVYLFIYRDPVEISRSLWSRNQYPPKLIMALWERYLGDALNATRGKRRLLLRYPDLIRDPQSTIRNLIADFRRVGVEPPNSLEDTLERIRVDNSLRHHLRNPRELEISFTESQNSLHNQVRDGTALTRTEKIDVSEANRQIFASREIVDHCRTHSYLKHDLPGSPHPTETLACLTREIHQATGEKMDTSALTSRFLEAARASFLASGREAMEALEAIHLLTFHFNRTKAFKAGGDYAIATVAVWCDELCQGLLISPARRKSRRAFLDYRERLPRTLTQVIRRSGNKAGRQWLTLLTKAGEAAKTLLGNYAMGKLPLLPDIEDASRKLETSIERYRASLTACAGEIREVSNAINAFRLHMEKAMVNPPPARSGDASTDEADALRILEWAEKLCCVNPLSLTRYKAAKEYRAYRKKTGQLEVRDAERFQKMAPVVDSAHARLSHLLTMIEQAVALLETIQSKGDDPQGLPAQPSCGI